MWKTVRLAYTGWFAVVAVCVSAFALANFLFRVWDVGLSQIFANVLDWYRQIAHGLLDYVLLPFRITITPPIKDLLTLALMFGGLVSRTVNYIYARGYPHDVPPNAVGVNLIDRSATDRKVIRALVLLVTTAVFWPYFVIRLATKPYIMTAGGLGLYLSDSKHTKNTLTYDTFEFDSRLVFLVYVVTLLLSFVVFFALNALLPSVR
jgi:hypothetical protein